MNLKPQNQIQLHGLKNYFNELTDLFDKFCQYWLAQVLLKYLNHLPLTQEALSIMLFNTYCKIPPAL